MAETSNKDLDSETGAAKRKEATGPDVSNLAKKRKMSKTAGKYGMVKMMVTPPKCKPGGMLLNWPPDPVSMSKSKSEDNEEEVVGDVFNALSEDARVSDTQSDKEKGEGVKGVASPSIDNRSKRKTTMTRKKPETAAEKVKQATRKSGQKKGLRPKEDLGDAASKVQVVILSGTPVEKEAALTIPGIENAATAPERLTTPKKSKKLIVKLPVRTQQDERLSAISEKSREEQLTTPTPTTTETSEPENVVLALDNELSEAEDWKITKLALAEAQAPVAGTKPIRRIQPTPVTGNTPPPSPKVRPAVSKTSATGVLRASTRKAGSRSEKISTPIFQGHSSGKEGSYTISRDQTPAALESTVSCSQVSLSPSAKSEISYCSSSSRRKRFPPSHLPGGLGVRVHGKAFPRGVTAPSSQQILNIITPGVRRRRVTPWITDKKASALAEEIFAAKALVRGNVYDVLRMPVYRIWEEQRQNYEKIVHVLMQEMAGGGKVVLGFTYVRQAWSIISTPERKAVYDQTLKAQIAAEDTALVPSMSGLGPVLEGQSLISSFHDLGDERGSGLEDTKYMAFRVHKLLRMPFHSHISFWSALAYVLRGDMQFWESIKAMTLRFWTSVLESEDPVHPRKAGYNIIRDYGISRGDESLESQLIGDHRVTPEMWQVTADTFSVELLTIINTPPNSRDKRINTLPVVPRGSHNRQQVFIVYHPLSRCYEPVYPVNKQAGDWRYERHMPIDRVNAPQGDVVEKAEMKKRVSDERRCPFLERDWRGALVQPVKKMKGYEGAIEAPGALVSGGLW
ncbi:hypothetical protein HYFRA_00011128 [Hymenoscyphus fraxineus]|uniref:Uncharacterized protein n=1 Tax=Hymenoscyphus fraxineus TaxID=746836 RepID=A0A9N9L232_9HELO|nr:hypothetical protein HYFRA_00011128 [Hymenoscyphus fraxineus]